jgi:hypothetical protein
LAWSRTSRFRRKPMKHMHIPRRLMLFGGVAAAVFAVAGLFAMAQTTTTSPTAGVLSTAATAPKGSATPEMIQEACQRQRARTAKFLQFGTPELFGSEEPFTFDPNTPCS